MEAGIRIVKRNFSSDGNISTSLTYLIGLMSSIDFFFFSATSDIMADFNIFGRGTLFV